MEAEIDMSTQDTTARAARTFVPPAANDAGARQRRSRLVELQLVELSPWLRDPRAMLHVPGIHDVPLDAAGGGWARRFADLLLTWLQRSRERRLLGTLSDHMLEDMGLSRADVDRETSRRFWQG
jgi:uncharacterized protein YjiS (DUF1127 family)